MLERRESRPVASRTATSSTAIKNGIIVRETADDLGDLEHRCRECRHVLTAEKSVALGIGPDCRRLLREAGQAVAA